MKITDEIHFFPWMDMRVNNGNTIFLDGPVKVLIDPGHAQTWPLVERQMSAQGLDTSHVDLVIATHGHPDHLEAAASFPPPTRIAMHPDEERYIAQIGPAFYQAMGLPAPEFRVDLLLQEGDLELGDTRWRVIHAPGHSPGSICLYQPQDKVLITGDVVFAMGVGRTDFPGGSGEQLKKSIQTLSTLDVDVLLPGHGEAVRGAAQVKQNFAFIEQAYFPML